MAQYSSGWLIFIHAEGVSLARGFLYTRSGRQHELGLGSVLTTTLAQAR